MQAASYGVIAWAAADFDFPHAELTVQALCELVKDLNRETRFSGLPLGGSDGDITADSVLLWQTGFGGRTSFGQGIPDHDAYHYSTARLLAAAGRRAGLDLQLQRGPHPAGHGSAHGGAGRDRAWHSSGSRRSSSPSAPRDWTTPAICSAPTGWSRCRCGGCGSPALPSVAEAIAAIEAAL